MTSEPRKPTIELLWTTEALGWQARCEVAGVAAFGPTVQAAASALVEDLRKRGFLVPEVRPATPAEVLPPTRGRPRRLRT